MAFPDVHRTRTPRGGGRADTADHEAGPERLTFGDPLARYPRKMRRGGGRTSGGLVPR